MATAPCSCSTSPSLRWSTWSPCPLSADLSNWGTNTCNVDRHGSTSFASENGAWPHLGPFTLCIYWTYLEVKMDEMANMMSKKGEFHQEHCVALSRGFQIGRWGLHQRKMGIEDIHSKFAGNLAKSGNQTVARGCNDASIKGLYRHSRIYSNWCNIIELST